MRYIAHIAALTVIVVAPHFVSQYRWSLLVEILIFGILVMSLDLLIGFTGLVSLGHATFFGVGAYAAAFAGVKFGLAEAIPTLALGALAAGSVALLIGWFVTGTRGVPFIMLTIAFAEIFVVIALTWKTVTNGDDGIRGIPGPELVGGISLTGLSYYYYAVVVFALMYILLRILVSSPLGWTFRGIRSNETRMSALGFSVRTMKLLSFVIAGSMAGVAGALHSQHSGYVSPALLGFGLSTLLVVMHTVGGAGTLWGPVLGAAVVLVFRDEVSSSFPYQWQAMLGLLFIGVVYLAPGGLAGSLRGLSGYLRSRNKGASAHG